MDIAKLDAAMAERKIDALSDILWDCVEDGASVNFVRPFSVTEARNFWRKAILQLAAGTAVLLTARADGELAGTVMLGLDTPPNQPHRADIKKLLVHRRARRRGLGRALMLAAEAEARGLGRYLLTLDTEQGSEAEPLYRALGYVLYGSVPGYALPAGGGDAKACAFFYKKLG